MSIYCPCFNSWTIFKCFILWNISLYSIKTLGDFHKIPLFSSKLQVIFYPFFLLDLEFLLHFILPAILFQNSCIFPSLIPNFPCFPVYSDGIQSTRFSLSWRSHLLRGATTSFRASSPQHRILLSPVVLFMVQELLSYVSGPLGRLWVRTGIRSGKADSQRQFDPRTSRAMVSEHFYFLVPMGRKWRCW